MNFEVPENTLCNALEYFEKKSSAQSNGQLYGVCATGLTAISENLLSADQQLEKAQPYLQEMGVLLSRFVQPHQCPWEDPQAAAFQLVEGMAVVLREFYVSTGKAIDANAQAVFAYFENSGHWQADDGTLASTCYHSL